jgi:hypothetical protein
VAEFQSHAVVAFVVGELHIRNHPLRVRPLISRYTYTGSKSKCVCRVWVDATTRGHLLQLVHASLTQLCIVCLADICQQFAELCCKQRSRAVGNAAT